MDFLDKLNPQQRKAVTAGNGPILVLAGPGSGKTRVLTQRVAYLIANEGIRPYRILAVTFTNKAAQGDAGARRKALGADATQGMMLGTFHAICARLFRRETDYLPIQPNFVIFDADDQERIVKGIIKEFNLNDKMYRPVSVHASISNAKNELIGADDYPITNYRDEVVKRVYTEYQKRLISSNAVDFDDILMYTARLLEDHPDVREKYAAALRTRAGGRIPGYQPGAIYIIETPGFGASQHLRGRRPGSIDLPLEGRRLAQCAALRAGFSRSTSHFAGTKLSFAPKHPGCRDVRDRPRTSPP